MNAHSRLLYTSVGCLTLLLAYSVCLAQAPLPPVGKPLPTTQPATPETPAAPTTPPRPPQLRPRQPKLPTSQPTPTKDEDYTTTPSGLKYIDLKPGDGPSPGAAANVTVRYWGWLENGEMFDSSEKQRRPATFRLDRVVKGWTEGVASMKVGGKRKLIVPPELGYGDQRKPNIPANSTLIFEVELLSFDPLPQMPKLDALELAPTDSGLKYYDYVEGEGDFPSEEAVVEFHYRAWLGDGTFWRQSQKERPQRGTVRNEQLKGWSEGVQSMRPGGKRLMVIPPELAFGEREIPGVPANSTLVMEIELVKITEPPKPTETKDEDMVTTPSGLKYVDIKVGDGESPERSSVVTVHYTGWLEDGTVFISSLMQDRPDTFRLDKVVEGFTEGVSTMKVGGKRKLIVPPELAYGEKRRPPQIPINATLTYEVELLGTRPAPTPPSTQPFQITPKVHQVPPKPPATQPAMTAPEKSDVPAAPTTPK